MEEIDIINKLIDFLVLNGIKMENIELNLVKNKLTFKKTMRKNIFYNCQKNIKPRIERNLYLFL